MGMPWYRPTRAVHATSGSEFGWRSGTGKWPAYYVDSLPPMVDIGPGSPVGVDFGYGAKFPAKYQKALFICDWTFGTMYALHLEPDGSTLQGREGRVPRRGRRCPLTDVAVGPDGALYFTVGGRGTAVGAVPRDLRRHGTDRAGRRPRRRRAPTSATCAGRWIEQYHRRADDPGRGRRLRLPATSATPTGSSATPRGSRWSTRTSTLWQDRVLAETDPETLITGAVGAGPAGGQGAPGQAPRRARPARLRQPDRVPATRPAARLVARLHPDGRARPGRPPPGWRRSSTRYYPAKTDPLNRELCNLLVYLKSPDRRREDDRPDAAGRASRVGPDSRAAGPEPRLRRHRSPRCSPAGPTRRRSTTPSSCGTRRRAGRSTSGGSTSSGSQTPAEVERRGELPGVPQQHRQGRVRERERCRAPGRRGDRRPAAVPGRRSCPSRKGPGHAWTLDELTALAEAEAEGPQLRERPADVRRRPLRRLPPVRRRRRRDRPRPDPGRRPVRVQGPGRGDRRAEQGRLRPVPRLGRRHRLGPGRTPAGSSTRPRQAADRRRRPRRLDQGRRDPQGPRSTTVKPSPVSLMPENLLGTLNENEVLDLLAYLLSRGDPNDPMFRK